VTREAGAATSSRPKLHDGFRFRCTFKRGATLLELGDTHRGAPLGFLEVDAQFLDTCLRSPSIAAREVRIRSARCFGV
jgi:hypothetical protein